MQIRGKWDTGQVWIDDRELSPERSQALMNHSPTGFAWGYGGSGPAQLALALLLEIARNKEMALLWYQDVKRHIIARLPQADFTLDSQEIIDFIVNAVQELLNGPNGHVMAAVLDVYHCPTHGVRRYSLGEVRQAEQDETCVYVCADCGEVAEPECFEEGRRG
jgi:Family of unknown function (DUF6166)